MNAQVIAVAPQEPGRRDKNRGQRPKKRFEENFRPRISHPMARLKVRLSSAYAQKVYDNGYPRVSQACYFVLVMMRVLATRARDADDAEKELRAKVKAMDEEITAEITKLETEVAEYNLTGLEMEYSRPKTVEVLYHTALAGNFLGMLGKLDRLLCALDKLWLHEYLSTQERGRKALAWQKKMLNFCTSISDVHQRAKAAAHRRTEDAQAKLEKVQAVAGIELPVDEVAPRPPAPGEVELDSVSEAVEEDANAVVHLNAGKQAPSAVDDVEPLAKAS